MKFITFFNLHFPLNENIEIWKKKDQRMKEITNKITGLRILKTDPVESFFFIFMFNK